MKPKERYRVKLMEYLSEPANRMPSRTELAGILGISKPMLYNHFKADELTEIETEALKERRKKYAPHLSKVDISVLEKAAEGDSQAAKLAYQRFEGWTEKQRLDHSSEDGTMTPPQRIEIVAAGFDDDSEA
jgi:hypothetical protein